ncbi:MAG: sulfatase [Myxococcota bacterium]
MARRPADEPAALCRARRAAAILAAIAFLAAPTAPARAGAQPSAQRRPPNVLLIVAEDLGPRLGAYGDPVARTPRIDALARDGVRYTRAFTVAGVCAPSRAGLLLGLHPIATGSQHMRTTTRPAGAYWSVPPPEAKAFPELLRAAGHYTYNVAKTDYQFSPPLGGGPFTIWDANGLGVAPTDWPAHRTFFGMVNLGVTHESGVFRPLGARPRSPMHFALQLARAFELRGAPSVAPTDPASVPLPPYYADTPAMRADLARHYDDVAVLDLQVGAILDRLERDGLADHTIVVFTTDHGDGLPRAKRELYDSGLLVPLVVRYPERHRPPGVRPGSVDDRLVSFVDLGPQILAWMGADVPRWMHGHPFAEPGAPRRDYVFGQRDRMDEVVDRQRSVRDEHHLYIRSWHPEVPGGHPLAFRDLQDGVRDLRARYERGELDAVQRAWFEPVARERLYDTVADPHQIHDLAADPALAPVLARMRSALDAWLARVGDASDEDEDAMAERFWPGGRAPDTARPTARFEAGALHLACPTDGASIGHRRAGERTWHLYTAPIPLAGVPPGTTIEARAVRYGHLESDIARFAVPARAH